MSKRERWIVYPLLVFSLMMGLKTSIPPLILRARSVECKSLQVELINGRPAVALTTLFDLSSSVLAEQGETAETNATPADAASGQEADGDAADGSEKSSLEPASEPADAESSNTGSADRQPSSAEPADSETTGPSAGEDDSSDPSPPPPESHAN